eukprot:TRINITY_DN1602_c0_g1_i2.p1 TRINITY_DN1602_c0_g1~~TRINITY_DN1602_c0_g1_i2.p1  ORF type:complete len:392 (+),score=57.56 TRINITY_DN1602_c0_g1_i2:123-1298(+)
MNDTNPDYTHTGTGGGGDLLHANLTQVELTTFKTIYVYLNWTSLILCFLLLLIFLIVRRSFPANIPFFMGLTICLRILVGVFSQIVGFELSAHPTYCLIQASLWQYLSVAHVAWFFILVFHLYLVTVRKYTAADIRKLQLVTHCLAWGVPIIFTVPPLVFQRYGPRGPSGEWCWITIDEGGAWGFGFYYIPVLIVMALVIFFWISVWRNVLKVSSQFKTKAFIIHRLVAVLVLVFQHSVGATHRILAVNGISSFPIEMVTMITTSLSGVYMFLGFGLTYDKMIDLKARCMKVRAKGQRREMAHPGLLNPSLISDVSSSDQESDGVLGGSQSHLSHLLLSSSPGSADGGLSHSMKSASSLTSSFRMNGTGLSPYRSSPLIPPFGQDDSRDDD